MGEYRYKNSNKKTTKVEINKQCSMDWNKPKKCALSSRDKTLVFLALYTQNTYGRDRYLLYSTRTRMKSDHRFKEVIVLLFDNIIIVVIVVTKQFFLFFDFYFSSSVNSSNVSLPAGYFSLYKTYSCSFVFISIYHFFPKQKSFAVSFFHSSSSFFLLFSYISSRL